MASITIDGKEYNIEDLSDTAKGQLSSLQFVQAENRKLEAQIAVNKTAASLYTNALKKELED